MKKERRRSRVGRERVNGKTAPLLGGKTTLGRGSRSGRKRGSHIYLERGTRRARCGTSSGDLRSLRSAILKENRSAALACTRPDLLASITREFLALASSPLPDRETNSSILAQNIPTRLKDLDPWFSILLRSFAEGQARSDPEIQTEALINREQPRSRDTIS
jgi:hypothetical protein